MTPPSATPTNDRHNALMGKLREECIQQGHREGSHEYYAALCGKMSTYLLIEMVHHDFWENAHKEALKTFA